MLLPSPPPPPPGTGKTLIARACAAQTNATFLKLAGTSLVQMFIGDGAKMVRDAFALAKEKQPCIIFIDEIDSIGELSGWQLRFGGRARRGGRQGGWQRQPGSRAGRQAVGSCPYPSFFLMAAPPAGTTRRDSEMSGDREVQRTMLELLNQLDGFSSSDEVKIIAATNRPDILDPALMRSGGCLGGEAGAGSGWGPEGRALSGRVWGAPTSQPALLLLLLELPVCTPPFPTPRLPRSSAAVPFALPLL